MLGPPVPKYTYVGPEFVGPPTSWEITDPRSWCLAGQPIGTQGPCGVPSKGEYVGDRGDAVYDYFSQAGQGVVSGVDGLVGGSENATTTVLRYRGGRQVRVRVLEYKKGLGDLESILGPAEQWTVKVAKVGRAFLVVQVGVEAFSDWRTTEGRTTVYRVGYMAAKTTAVVTFGWAGAAVGAEGGAIAGGLVGSALPVIGNATGAAVGGIVGGIAGGIGFGYSAGRAVDFTWERM